MNKGENGKGKMKFERTVKMEEKIVKLEDMHGGI